MVNKRQYANFNKNFHEKEAWQAQKVVCGIDEVGRGCLAGPVVTAALILKPGKLSPLLKDSKEMTHEERLKAANWIAKNSWYGFGIIDNRLIDKYNIYHATLISMQKALINLLAVCPMRPEKILVDAMPLTINDTGYKDIEVNYFCFGESKSSSIAAASIMAKIKRDGMMVRYNNVFPGYALNEHKGYNTKKHKDAVIALQPSIIHRQTFLNHFYKYEQDEHEQQQIIR